MEHYMNAATDLLMLLLSYLLAVVLTRLFPGAVKESSTQRGNTHLLETKRSLKRVMLSIYIVLITLLVHEESVIAIHKMTSITEEGILQALLVGGRLAEAWLLFWAFSFFLFLLEYLLRYLHSRHANELPLPNLLANLLRWFALIVLATAIGHYLFKWHIASVVASTTVLTATLGFAMKGLVGDLISGIAINLTRSVLPSQWVTIPSPRFPDSQITGEVILTNLRETRIRSTSGHLYIVPNSHMARSVIHNMSWPDNRRRHNIHFTLSVSCHPDTVMKALVAATEGIDVILDRPSGPQAMIVGYTDLGVKYRLRFWTRLYHDKTSTEGKILRAVWDQFKEHDITLPVTETILGQAVSTLGGGAR